MKSLLMLMLLTTSFGQAATWIAEVQNMETMEIKTFKYNENKLYILEMPNTKDSECSISIDEPFKSDEEPQLLQKAIIMCSQEGASYIVAKICSNSPDLADKANSIRMQVVNGADKIKKNMKKGKPLGKYNSYVIKLSCT